MVDDEHRRVRWFEEPGSNDDGSDSDPYGETAPEKVLAALARDTPQAA